jgi:uncharacterized protein (TIGR03032 family)
VLASALARASAVWHLPDREDPITQAVPELDASARGWDSHVLLAADGTEHAQAVVDDLAKRLVDREGKPIAERAGIPVLWNARFALRIPFLAAAFPESRFVLCIRDPADATEDMIRAWQGRTFVSAGELPEWTGQLKWSLPLIEGWRELNGKPLEEIVVAQWSALSDQVLDDLEALPPERWAISDFDSLLADPSGELRRLCDFSGIEYDQALLTPVEATARQLAMVPHRPSDALLSVLETTKGASERTRDLLPTNVNRETSASGRAPAASESPFRSSFTSGFPQALTELRSSLLISTYQSGRLICARANGGMLNTHLRDFDKPMGIAVGQGRFALGTRTEIIDFRDHPAVAAKVDPPGTHDACFLPLNHHTTGDVLIHDMTFDKSGELWAVATQFSCLVTFNQDSSFIPRWKPEFISELAAGDRCHLNGLSNRDGRPRYVTALGTTDKPGTWREHKATGGVLIDITTNETIVEGLCMPHSPRWHEGHLWLLESGKGELARVNVADGTIESVAELPGFTRGMAIVGNHAFIGLSQIRESSTFGDLPITKRLQERNCGVWMIDLRSGQTTALLRFEDLIQEIFEVSLLPGVRYPEIAEQGSSATSTTFTAGKPKAPPRARKN